MIRSAALTVVTLVGALAAGPDLFAHRAGLWSLPPAGETERWIEIHNLEEAKTSGTFHVDVLGRRRGDLLGKSGTWRRTSRSHVRRSSAAS